MAKQRRRIPYSFFAIPLRFIETGSWQSLSLLDLRAYMAAAYELRRGKDELSVRQVAKRAKMSTASAKRSLLRLRERGMLAAEKKLGRPTAYEIIPPPLTSADLK